MNACNIATDDQVLINKLHILEEYHVSPVRYSQDKYKIDRYGKRLFDLCKSTLLFFVNGRHGSDRGIGQTTCNNSLIDYAIISPELFRYVTDFNVLTFDPILSYMHNPVCLHLCSIIRTDGYVDDTGNNDSLIEINSECEHCVKTRWCRERAAVFAESREVSKIDELLGSLEGIDPQNTKLLMVIVESCNSIIKDAAELVL